MNQVQFDLSLVHSKMPKTKIYIVCFKFDPEIGPSVRRPLGWLKFCLEKNVPVHVFARSSGFSSYNKHTSRIQCLIPSLFDLNLPLSPFAKRLLLLFYSLFMLPDALIFWSLRCFLAVYQQYLCDKHSYDKFIVITTMGPFSLSLVGFISKLLLSFHWVADYRDPWSDGKNWFYLPFYRYLNSLIERFLVGRASIITTVSSLHLSNLADRLSLPKSSCYLLRNGYYKTSSYRPSSIKTDFACLTFGYFGSLSRSRSLANFFCCIDSLDLKRFGITKLKLVYAGPSSKILKSYTPSSTSIELVDYGVIPPNTVYELIQTCSVLILLTSFDDPSEVTGKIFEILSANKPILHLGNAVGEAASLIRVTKSGLTSSNIPDKILSSINALVARFPDFERSIPDPKYWSSSHLNSSFFSFLLDL